MDGILGNVTIRDEQAHEAASMYYLQGQTMETIARHLGVSRSSVSRLLTYARNSGLVRISVAATQETAVHSRAKLTKYLEFEHQSFPFMTFTRK